MVLIANNDKLGSCPDNIAVIGGGRWARVLTEVLCGVVPSSVRISVHSPHNAKAMSSWILERGLEQRVFVSSGLPVFPLGTSNAAIVVNAARDHEKSIEWAITAGIPVLVEKPLALSYSATKRLADLARSQKTYFAAAHVFLFARYIQTLSRLVTDEGRVQHINVFWMDPRAESRYGEAKSYDPGLTIFADWLPHVMSILSTLTSSQDQRCEKLELLRGGAYLEIDLVLGDIPCHIQLVRNGIRRQRIIEVVAQSKMFKLDFSSEPGTIVAGSATLCGDPDWDSKAKPVAKMLGAFLQGAVGGVGDNRLDVEIGLRACRMIDNVSPLYQSAFSTWLSNKLSMVQNCDDSDLRYAFGEMIYAEYPHSSLPLDQRINHVYRFISAHVMKSLNADLKYDTYVELIRLALKQGNHLSQDNLI
ncbi:MAG: Gfo/Idh/MocA family oxidoreductase [Nitrospirae bacterium]|nr:Gfo/Idh/MocA family oxidoreductase [Nitrospirota bacterium]